MRKLVVFCAVISVAYGGYETNAAGYSSDGYYQNLGYSHSGAGGNGQRYITNSLDYSPGLVQQQYQYPQQYQQDDLKKAPEYIPIIENGVPKDTPEVQRAKDDHFALFKKLAEAAKNAPENEGQEEELEQEKNIYQKYQRIQPNINYAPKAAPNNQQHFTEVLHPKHAAPQPRPHYQPQIQYQPQPQHQPQVQYQPQPQHQPQVHYQPQPQPQYQQYYQPAPVAAPVKHHQPAQHSAAGGQPHGIFIVGPDEPKEVQQARADHLAAHKDALAYIHHSRRNNNGHQQQKVYSGQHQSAPSYAPQVYEAHPRSFAVSPQGYSHGSSGGGYEGHSLGGYERSYGSDYR